MTDIMEAIVTRERFCPVGRTLKWWRERRQPPSKPKLTDEEKDAAEQKLRDLARERKRLGGWHDDHWKN